MPRPDYSAAPRQARALALANAVNRGEAVTAAAIVKAVADSELTPAEAGELSALVGTLAKMIEITELDHRVHALQKRLENSHEP